MTKVIILKGGFRMKKLFIFLPLFILLGFNLGFSQERTGILTGKVIDEQEESLPGVAITITGPALIEGSRSIITNERGLYRFILLPPGVYSLEAKREGFATQEQKDIKISLGHTTTVIVILKIAKLSQEVTVISQAPLVDVETNKSSVNFTTDFLQRLPTSRDLNTIMNMTPGIKADWTLATGASGSQFPERASEGGGSRENYFSMDGVYVTEPYTSQQMISFSYDIIEEIQVGTSGHNAEYGNATGAVVNVVTKSGGDNVHGLANFFYRNKSLRSENWKNTGLSAPTEAVKREGEASLSIGGPIKKGRVWYFLSADYFPSISETVGFPQDIKLNQGFFFGKATIQLNPKNKFSLVYNYSDNNCNHMYASQFRTPESTLDTKLLTSTFNAQWNFIINPNAVLETRLSFVKKYTAYNSNGPGPSYNELSTGVMTKSTGFNNSMDRRLYQFQLSLSYWLQGLAGDHDIKAGIELRQGQSGVNATQQVDERGISSYSTMNGIIVNATGYPEPHSESKDIIKEYTLYTQDTWKFGRVNLNLGGRLTYANHIIPKQNKVPETISVYDFTTFEPRIGFVYDISSRNRKMAVKVHYGRYDQASLILYGVNPNSSPSIYYVVSGENFIPMTIVPATIPVDPKVKKPYADSFILGFETGLGRNLALKVNGIYKKMKNYIGQIDLNRTPEWYDPVVVNDPITNLPLTVYSLKTGAPPSKPYYTHPADANRKYRAVEVILERRLANHLQLFLSYIWSRAEGTVPQGVWNYGGNRIYGVWNDPNFLINKSGLLDLDRTHQIKFSGAYFLPYDFVIGLNYVGQSGYPYAQKFNYKLGQGTLSFNGEKPGSQRLPFQHIVDIRVEKNFIFRNIRPKIFLEAFNLLNGNTALSIGNLYGSPTFTKTTAILPPRIFKLGIGFAF